MEYTCLEGMTLPFLLKEKTTMNRNSMFSLAAPDPLESFHVQQQQLPQLNQSYNFFIPQHCNLPAVTWSTTDPTLLITDQQQQQDRPEFLFTNGSDVKVSCDSSRNKHMDIDDSCCQLSSFSTVQQVFQSRGSSDLHHHAGVNNVIAANTAEQMNLHGDMTTKSGTSNRRDNGLSSSSSASSIDPFSFCAGGGRGSGLINASSSHSQWMQQQMCSLSSDQYYGCLDSSMPKLVSDPFTDSPQQQQQPCSYHTSSTSINCLHEADSCGSSDRDRSTTSEEMNWMNSSSCNDSDLSNLSNLTTSAFRGKDSVTGLLFSSPVPLGLSDELSSSIADDVELATTPTILDHVQDHHLKRDCGSISPSLERGVAAAPSGRLSWMSPGTGSVQKDNRVTTTTLDPLLLLGSGPAPAAATSLSATRSALGPLRPLPQHRAYTLEVLTAGTHPFSYPASQHCGSCISPRCGSVYTMPPAVINPGMVDNCTGSGRSFYEELYGFSSRPQQRHSRVLPASSFGEPTSVGGVGITEFDVRKGFLEPRKDFSSDQTMLLSASRKPNATSIEPQSVAARHRRKKISERVRILEKLIPGGNKMDTASMLDEAIEYVKFLQLQVQLLESMGEPETVTTEGRGSFTTAATTSTTMTTTSNCSAFHSHHTYKVDTCSSTLIGDGFGSSSHDVSMSSALIQQVTIAGSSSASKSPSSPPLILSEILQEQLFKQKLCLVSFRQYCAQGI